MNNDSQAILSTNVRALRRKKKMTQTQLGDRIGKTTEMICQLENGAAGTKISTLDQIADVLGVETYKLFMQRDMLDVETLSPELTELLRVLQGRSTAYIKALTDLVRAPWV